MKTLEPLELLELETRAPDTWKVYELEAYVGGLSAPSKMPGYAYSLPAAECRTGKRLQTLEGSTCHSCYALKGRYAFPAVQVALYRRLESLERKLWSRAMAELIMRRKQTFFRWHDSGDLQSLEHLCAIVDVCDRTPDVKHWLPTREYRIVAEYEESRTYPPNLNVRCSAHMIGGNVPTFPRLHVTVSTVSAGDPPIGAHRCPAPLQGNACGECRACWSKNVPIVDYHLH
jgi:hypothetical protein